MNSSHMQLSCNSTQWQTKQTSLDKQEKKNTMKYIIPKEKFLEDSILLVEIELKFELKKKGS